MLAHELRNPLAPIRNGAASHAADADAQAVKSVTEMMERQVGQMVRLVDDLLDVSRISQGKIELRAERIELASIVRDAVEAARPLCERMGHELTVTLPPEPIYLNADPARLAQVVGNLLNNACKFTERAARIRLTVEREGEQAVIRVRDTGIGIAADQLPRIFDMFMQVDTSHRAFAQRAGHRPDVGEEPGGDARRHVWKRTAAVSVRGASSWCVCRSCLKHHQTGAAGAGR